MTEIMFPRRREMRLVSPTKRGEQVRQQFQLEGDSNTYF